MEEQVELKLFTVADLKAYFMHNQPVELLSERVINHTRAYATIMNPYVTDDMGVVSAIFVNGEVAAYTYVFPDQCLVNGQQRTIYWNTVLYVDPRYEGRGYGAIVIGQMVEVYGDDYFDLDAVPASVENLKFAGLQVDYVPQYVLEQKHIQTSSFKGRLIATLDNCRIHHALRAAQHHLLLAPHGERSEKGLSIRYTSYIDDSTYAFIKEHSQNDIFLRSQAMFNWILNYPLGQESPLKERVPKCCAFGSTAERFHFYAVHVYVARQLVAVYLCRYNTSGLYINYLYYTPEYEQVVFASIMEHVIYWAPRSIFTAHRGLADYIDSLHVFAHKRIYNKTFSHPQSFVYDNTKFIQAGDGDNIT